jgi:hypothetical protein
MVSKIIGTLKRISWEYGNVKGIKTNVMLKALEIVKLYLGKCLRLFIF